jgi:hypothetical protein
MQHAFERPENLDLALDIGAAYGDIKKTLITRTANSMKRIITNAFDPSEWRTECEGLTEQPIPKFAQFRIGKTSWNAGYYIMLESQSPNGRDFEIGVLKPKGSHAIPGLREELDRRIRRGRPSDSDWWDWSYRLEAPFDDWNTKEALMRMFDGSAADSVCAKTLSNALLFIATVAGPILDGHFRRMHST